MNKASIQDSDAALLERLRQRDRGALEELVRVHGSKLYGVAMQFMRNETDAQEVMQDALVMVWRKIDSFEGRSAFTSWLYRVTANAALMKLRKEKKHEADVSMDADESGVARGEALGLSGPSEQPDASVSRQELGQQVRAAIDSLPEPYRTTVLLRDVEEFSVGEIAEMTGVSAPAVKSRLHRARLALRKLLLPYLKTGEPHPS